MVKSLFQIIQLYIFLSFCALSFYIMRNFNVTDFFCLHAM
jgi:hypothetical protein